MNEQIREQLSALMDGELDGHQARFVLARADADLVQRWGRYQVAAQVLRREPLAPLRSGFADAVMAGIAPLPRRQPMAQRLLRWGAGGALAASVAVAALVVTRPAGEVPGAAQPTLVRTPSSLQGSGAIAVAPAAATTTTFGHGQVGPPLLVPNAPLDAAPASFGIETLLVPALDPRCGAACGRPAQPTATAPSVLLLAPAARHDGDPAAARH
ncbi:MAG: sigma-E factor negative regulatory protein [Dokdonella sp.]|uniref:sigma-E factor negative regulatory protein n=1 Tax=Dokdonella sp. TaxID=2291710 RepID=UPI0025BB0DD7|nr:sigma-E factor negative regulatory protein [Dokdonella sp.]MBX3699990.1 sigma-E factor negative regulatory protein [Dokdonella sp.]MCW5578738.1 sigma-E factor negative regulatory protein [Dokdonella sp.]